MSLRPSCDYTTLVRQTPQRQTRARNPAGADKPKHEGHKGLRPLRGEKLSSEGIINLLDWESENYSFHTPLKNDGSSGLAALDKEARQI